MGIKVLITGVAGFIGSHLAERLLSEGFEVIGIDNFEPFYSRKIKSDNLSECFKHPSFHFLEIDLVDRESMSKIEKIHGTEVVIHLAAKPGVIPSLKNVQGFIEANIVGTSNLLDLMLKINCKKLIFASSSSIYGNNDSIPFNEKDSVDYPISPYAFTKKSCELLNHTYYHLYDFQIFNFRFFTVYGPRQRPDLAIMKFFNLIYQDETIEIFGDGNSSRDYTFIDDIIDGITVGIQHLLVQETSFYEIVNLGNNQPIKLSHLIACIEKVIGKKAKYEHKPLRDGEVKITYADISKAKAILGYNPKHTIFEGLEKFKTWYEAKQNKYSFSVQE